METRGMPEGAVELGGKVYRRKPWKGHFSALVLVGSMADVKDEAGKATGKVKFVPLSRGVASVDPLRASRKAAQKALKPQPQKAEQKAQKPRQKPEGKPTFRG